MHIQSRRGSRKGMGSESVRGAQHTAAVWLRKENRGKGEEWSAK